MFDVTKEQFIRMIKEDYCPGHHLCDYCPADGKKGKVGLCLTEEGTQALAIVFIERYGKKELFKCLL